MNAKKKFFTKWRCYVVCKETMSTCNVDYELNKSTMYLVYSVSLIDNRVDNKHKKANSFKNVFVLVWFCEVLVFLIPFYILLSVAYNKM